MEGLLPALVCGAVPEPPHYAECLYHAAGTEPIIKVVPFRTVTFGVVTTGSEVYHGRIKDTFTDVIVDKLAAFGGTMTVHEILDDDPEAITKAINKMIDSGVDCVFCTGGMSVDPDDQTPLAIKNTGASIISYGAPVLPGAMFLLAYSGNGQVIAGLPGCVMYAKRTIFDLVLPYFLAGVPITADLLARYGEGGLCLNCPVCTFPNCGFGK